MSDPEDVEPSPRTAEEPMAFTKLELLRGAVVAWGSFNLMLLIYALVPGWGYATWAIVTFFYAVPITGLLGPLLALPSCLVGHALRRTRPVLVHVLAQGAVGAMMTGVLLIPIALGPNSADLAEPSAYTMLVSATVALPLGWAWAYCRARRSDAQVSRHPSVGPSLADGGAAS